MVIEVAECPKCGARVKPENYDWFKCLYCGYWLRVKRDATGKIIIVLGQQVGDSIQEIKNTVIEDGHETRRTIHETEKTLSDRIDKRFELDKVEKNLDKVRDEIKKLKALIEQNPRDYKCRQQLREKETEEKKLMDQERRLRAELFPPKPKEEIVKVVPEKKKATVDDFTFLVGRYMIGIGILLFVIALILQADWTFELILGLLIVDAVMSLILAVVSLYFSQ